MSGLNRDDIIRIAKAVGLGEIDKDGDIWCTDGFYTEEIYNFAVLVVAAEREKAAKWMIQRGYATGHGDTLEDLLGELDWQLKERERGLTKLNKAAENNGEPL